MAGFLESKAITIAAMVILLVGAALYTAGSLSSSLASIHQISVAPSPPSVPAKNVARRKMSQEATYLPS